MASQKPVICSYKLIVAKYIMALSGVLIVAYFLESCNMIIKTVMTNKDNGTAIIKTSVLCNIWQPQKPHFLQRSLETKNILHINLVHQDFKKTHINRPKVHTKAEDFYVHTGMYCRSSGVSCLWSPATGIGDRMAGPMLTEAHLSPYCHQLVAEAVAPSPEL